MHSEGDTCRSPEEVTRRATKRCPLRPRLFDSPSLPDGARKRNTTRNQCRNRSDFCAQTEGAANAFACGWRQPANRSYPHSPSSCSIRETEIASTLMKPCSCKGKLELIRYLRLKNSSLGLCIETSANRFPSETLGQINGYPPMPRRLMLLLSTHFAKV